MVEPERLQMTMRQLVSCCISKATREKEHASVHAPTPTAEGTHACRFSTTITQCWVICTLFVCLRLFITNQFIARRVPSSGM
jgi:hypothetical protein